MVTESGALDDKQALEEVLLDIGQALLKGRKQRKISNGTQQLFMRHDGSKRTFTPALIKTIWRWIIQAFRRRGLNLIGFTFDGDARVSKSAMDFADKQCYEGALVLADFKTNTKAQDIKERGEVEEVRDVRDVLIKDDEFYGTYMYINFLHRFLRIFLIRGRSFQMWSLTLPGCPVDLVSTHFK
ncbi:hypothetical protein WJX77_006834 [Trebouxia sp. C0004]